MNGVQLPPTQGDQVEDRLSQTNAGHPEGLSAAHKPHSLSAGQQASWRCQVPERRNLNNRRWHTPLQLLNPPSHLERFSFPIASNFVQLLPGVVVAAALLRTPIQDGLECKVPGCRCK
jgi:hypothetical protein